MKQELARKVEQVEKVSSNFDKIRALTGYIESSNNCDMQLTRELVHLVGLLELYNEAYLQADCHFARAHSLSSVVNPPQNRLICYL